MQAPILNALTLKRLLSFTSSDIKTSESAELTEASSCLQSSRNKSVM